MVWDPPKIPVNVKRIVIYSIIPILSIYAAWRIQKLWVLVGIGLALAWGISIPIAMIFPSPYNYLITLGIEIPSSLLIVKHFAIKYNEKIISDDTQTF